jgi:hypothetical protein
MGTYYGHQIVTDGLVLCLDSGNIKSYPGTGTNWYDLSGNGNHGYLAWFSGPSPGATSGFDSNTNLMMFDRHLGESEGITNNVVTFNNSPSLNDCWSINGVTIELWVKMTTIVGTAIAKLHGSWEVYYYPYLVHRTTGGDGATTIPNTEYFNTFHHIIATHTGSWKTLFLNASNVLSIADTPAGDSFTSFGLGAYSDGTYAFVGSIPIFRVYNRALSQTEITQNYNALKGRFGL